jgi:hypothetical protein
MYLTIKDNKIVNQQEYIDWIVNAPDGRYIIRLEKLIRTTKQNAYLRWWVYKAICDHTGDTDDYIHWVMSMEFLVDRTKKMPFIKSTTKLSTKEFSEYVDKIKNFVSEYWVIIPTAQEYENFISDD